MDSLVSLDAREMALLRSARSLSGLIEEKEQLLIDGGCYVEAAAIHSGYVGLASPPSCDPEALKRAVFLGWYQDAEPGWITGIDRLDPATVGRALGLADEAVSQGHVDREFAVMLGWYWQVAPYHFTSRAPARLIDYLSTLEPSAYKAYGFSKSALRDRGQMGDYWVSVARPSD